MFYKNSPLVQYHHSAHEFLEVPLVQAVPSSLLFQMDPLAQEVPRMEDVFLWIISLDLVHQDIVSFVNQRLTPILIIVKDTYSLTIWSNNSRRSLISSWALEKKDRHIQNAHWIWLRTYQEKLEGHDSIIINHTGGPGSPCKPVKPLWPFWPLSPWSPRSPLSPLGPCGPCKAAFMTYLSILHFIKHYSLMVWRQLIKIR